MLRVTTVLAAGSYDAAGVADSVILNREERQAGRGVFITVNGMTIELNLPAPAMLRMGDALVLADGRRVEVVAEAELLFEVRMPDVDALARLAWQLGDRHIPVQILPKRLRTTRDPAVAAVLERLGIKPVAIEGPFDPEGGAYRVSIAHAHHPGEHGHPHDHHDHQDHHHHHRTIEVDTQ